MTIPFFKKLYKAFSISLCISTSLSAQSAHQELKNCKNALLSQLNEQKRVETDGCPVSQKLICWLGILRDPTQFTPKEIITFLTHNTHWPHHEKLCKKAESVIIESGSPTEIITWFEENTPQTPTGAFIYAKTLMALKEKAKAAKIIVSAWRTMELTKAEETKFISKFGHFLQEKDHLARLEFLLWDGNADAAKRLLPHIPINVRQIADVRIAFLKGQPDALNKLKGLSAKQQQDEGLLYELTHWHRKQDHIEEACNLLMQAPISAAYAQKWWTEKNYIAREFIALQEYQKAYDLLSDHALEPGNEDYANAEWLRGWLAFRFLKRPKDAHTHFETLCANVKGAVSKSRGAYWAGRVYEAQENFESAAKWYKKAAKYKTTYYGQLAAVKLREKPHPTLAAAPKATAAEQNRFDQKEIVKAAYILKGLGGGANHELSKFLLHIANQAETKVERELAVHLAHALSPYDIVWAAKKAGYSEPVALKKAYPIFSIPQKGQEIPEKAFVFAIAYQESRFNPTAQSPAGAIGLLQLMPATAAKEAKQLGIKHSERKLVDPQHNLVLGSSHLSQLLNRFDKSYILAAAAYNAGETPVKRWLKDFGDPRSGAIDIVDWIELIPYAETRNYVMRVLENITNYRSLEGLPKKTLIDDLQR
ncbi:MAG: lytic transglycosylase domain-containing protein [Proteobacteria bacterium]|nr:lytic transglycosylase domain-containing protein [Pseudomonadota bacterium]